MKRFKSVIGILTVSILSSLNPQLGAFANEGAGNDFAGMARRLRTLVMQYYPRAKFEIDGKSIHFEYDAWGDDEYYSGNTGHTLPEGGILGDVEEKPGPYKNELSGVANQFTMVFMPYSKARNAHLLARLHIPTDVSVHFTRHFKDVMNSFYEAGPDEDVAEKPAAPKKLADSDASGLPRSRPESMGKAKRPEKKDEPLAIAPLRPRLKKGPSTGKTQDISKLIDSAKLAATAPPRNTQIKQAPPPDQEEPDMVDAPLEAQPDQHPSREPRVRFFPNGSFAVLSVTRPILGYSHVGDLAMVNYTFGDPKTAYNRVSFQDVPDISSSDPQARNDLYDKAQRSIIAGKDERLNDGIVKTGRRQFEGQSAREILITPPDGSKFDFIERYVMLLASGRLFILESAGPEDFVDSSSSLKLIGSFKVTGEAPSAPELAAGTEFFHWQRPTLMTEIKAVDASSPPAAEDLSKSAAAPKHSSQ